MATDEKQAAPEAATKKTAVTAVTSTTEDAKVGDVLSFAVRTPGGDRPVFTASDQGSPIYAEKTGDATWVASWAVTRPGTHTVTAGAADAEPAVFTINAKEA